MCLYWTCSYKFISGKAENVFFRLERLIPSWIDLKTANVIGIIDPPRAGIHEKVVIGCRAVCIFLIFYPFAID